MKFAKYRDFYPMWEYKGYTLGRFEHDDGDVIKWDWSVYRYSGIEQFETSPNTIATNEMYDELCSIDVSPYERDLMKIKEAFKKAIKTLKSA